MGMGHLTINDRINQLVEGVEEDLTPEEVDPDAIRITAPKEPEVNPEVYRDVESLLFKGFIILPAMINGVHFLFKSMNHHEFEYLNWIAGSGTPTGRSIERYYSSFISYGVFMIDGQNILPNRDQWVPQIEDSFNSFAPPVRSKIIRYLSEVNKRAANAITMTEAFNTERLSRFKWAQYKNLDLMSSACTGVEGTEKLGLNYAQLVWRALNYYEDLKEAAEREWDNAKFIGSCFAGKEIRKIYNQDKDRRQKEHEERLKKRDKILRQVILHERPDEAEIQGRYTMTVARSAEELANQLEKDLRGEKDWHDEVVAREEARIREQIQERQKKLQTLFHEKDKKEILPYMTSTSLEGLSIAEVQQRVERSKQIQSQQAASRMVFPEMTDDRMGTFLEKYVDAEDSTYQASGVRSTIGVTNRDVSEIRPFPPTRPRSSPFRK
jgi:hypothetical protein